MIFLSLVVFPGLYLMKLYFLALSAIHPSGGTLRCGGRAGGREAGGTASVRAAG